MKQETQNSSGPKRFYNVYRWGGDYGESEEKYNLTLIAKEVTNLTAIHIGENHGFICNSNNELLGFGNNESY